MTNTLRYLTHPQVRIDSAVPVPKWGLSDIGRERALSFAAAGILNSTKVIVSSAETKAIETAEIISDVIKTPIKIVENTHENDRSATGFLESAEFESVADLFFRHSHDSIRGWERAIDAQSRIVRETKTIIETYKGLDILMVGHGAVGTLLYCHLAELEINRDHDQPGGGGNMFSYDLDNQSVVHSWKSIENLMP